MVDLSTTYLGLNLKNPLVASASPLSKKVDQARKLEEAGISAIVMYSLFEEQITFDSLYVDYLKLFSGKWNCLVILGRRERGALFFSNQ